MIPVVYTEQYNVSFEGHVFPVEKYNLIFRRLMAEKLITAGQVFAPDKVAEAELLAVHTKDYLDDLLNLRWTTKMISSELPLTREIVEFFLYTAGGSILSTKLAQEYKAAFHIGGGFHHAFADHAEGFCYINDIAVAVKIRQKANPQGKFLVFDCDLHQGNGTAKIFEDDENVITCSIHQENLYPVKQKSDLDIGLSDYADDSEYLEAEGRAIDILFGRHHFDTVFYVAGADPFAGDKLGTLQVTKDGLKQRDRMIFNASREARSNMIVILAGGYALNTIDVVDIHVNTFIELQAYYG